MADAKTGVLNIDIQEFLKKSFEKELEKALAEEYEKLKVDLLDRLDKRKAEILASLTLYFMKRMEMTRSGELLTIQLKVEDIPNS